MEIIQVLSDNTSHGDMPMCPDYRRTVVLVRENGEEFVETRTTDLPPTHDGPNFVRRIPAKEYFATQRALIKDIRKNKEY